MEAKVFLNRYRLSLGRNGVPVELHRMPQGVTYRAQDIESGREVAVELVPWSPKNPEARSRMEKAATAAMQINHVNIPTLRDFAMEGHQLVFVTDSLDGYTAEAWVAARGPLPLGAVLRVALQVAAAFGAMSFHRLHHPAINPANIIFVLGQTEAGDWPAIKIVHGLWPDESGPVGGAARAETAARYASPEQVQGGEPDFASSIFSLGCTMWFLMTGTPPAVPGGDGVRESVATLRGVPKIVRHLLAKMLQVDPKQRPQDPVVLQAYLQTCLARVERREKMGRRFGVAPKTAAVATARQTGQSRKFDRKALALAAVLLLFGTVAVVALPRIFRAHRGTAGEVARDTSTTPVPTTLVKNERAVGRMIEPAPPEEGPRVEIATAAVAATTPHQSSENKQSFAAVATPAAQAPAPPLGDSPSPGETDANIARDGSETVAPIVASSDVETAGIPNAVPAEQSAPPVAAPTPESQSPEVAQVSEPSPVDETETTAQGGPETSTTSFASSDEGTPNNSDAASAKTSEPQVVDSPPPGETDASIARDGSETVAPIVASSDVETSGIPNAAPAEKSAPLVAAPTPESQSPEVAQVSEPSPVGETETGTAQGGPETSTTSFASSDEGTPNNSDAASAKTSEPQVVDSPPPGETDASIARDGTETVAPIVASSDVDTSGISNAVSAEQSAPPVAAPAPESQSPEVAQVNEPSPVGETETGTAQGGPETSTTSFASSNEGTPNNSDAASAKTSEPLVASTTPDLQSPERASEVAERSDPPPGFDSEAENTPPQSETRVTDNAEANEKASDASNPPLLVDAAPTPAPKATPATRKRRKSVAVAKAKKSSSRVRKKTRVAHAEVRRGHKIPELKVGSSRAELVGTTKDGRWIVSVSSSGERIVVPPPPGFGR